MQKGGRKIKRSKNLYGSRRRSRTKSAIKAVLMVVVLGGLLFLGYSAGKPIFNFIKGNSESSSASSEPWSPSDVVISSSDSDSTSEASSETDSTSSQPDKTGAFLACELPAESLQTAASLTAAVNSAKQQGCTAAVVTLKTQGGLVRYKTSVEIAQKASGITSELTAAQAAEIIKGSGMTAIARVSTLYDNITPKADKTLGYFIANSDSSWFDNSPAKGGKPWMNPLSENTQTFFNQLSGEIGAAGFDDIICSDVIFAPFRDTDLNYVGPAFSDENRYIALIQIVDIFRNNAQSSHVGVEVSALEVLMGTAEVFKPAMLDNTVAVIHYRSADYNSKFVMDGVETDWTKLSVYDRVKTVFSTVKGKTGTLPILPCISTADMSENDRAEVIRALEELDYNSYILQ